MTDTADIDIATEEDVDTQKDKYLTFHIADEEYGIAISYVTEIIGMQKFTEVPETPDYIKGVINLRGKVIPIMDIRLRFAMTEKEYDERTCVIVVNFENTAVGLVVDTVSEVVDIPASCIEISPNFNTDQGHFVEGMGKLDENIKMLLDVKSLLYDDEHSIAEV